MKLKQSPQLLGMRYEDEILRKRNIKISGLVEYYGAVAKKMHENIKSLSEEAGENLDRRFELNDTIKDYL